MTPGSDFSLESRGRLAELAPAYLLVAFTVTIFTLQRLTIPEDMIRAGKAQ